MATSVLLSIETEQRLEALASQTGRSKSLLLDEVIERGFEDIEDYYLAAAVLERIRQGREEIHAAAEVRRDLDLDN